MKQTDTASTLYLCVDVSMCINFYDERHHATALQHCQNLSPATPPRSAPIQLTCAQVMHSPIDHCSLVHFRAHLLASCTIHFCPHLFIWGSSEGPVVSCSWHSRTKRSRRQFTTQPCVLCLSPDSSVVPDLNFTSRKADSTALGNRNKR
jgi:hypothetical protein